MAYFLSPVPELISWTRKDWWIWCWI